MTGLLAMRWADYTLGHNLSVTLQIKPGHSLITEGPYRWVRHPIYVATLMFALGMSLVSSNVLVAACFLGGMLLLCAVRIPQEEDMMVRQFGDEYRRYMQRTGRLLPRLYPARG